MQVVQLQTTIQTVFGLVDENGNVTPQSPVVVDVGGLENLLLPDVGAEAHAAIIGKRDEAIAQIDAITAAQAEAKTPKTAKAKAPRPTTNRAQRRGSAKRTRR